MRTPLPDTPAAIESEHGQALVRLYAGLAMLVCFAVAGALMAPHELSRAIWCVGAYVVYAAVWVRLVVRDVGAALPRQLTALLLDHAVYGACFAVGGPFVAFLTWVSVTTSVGHGLRFGQARGVAAA